MTTFPASRSATTRQKITSLFLLGLCLYVGVRGWELFTASLALSLFALATLVLALLRGLDPFLSQPSLVIDDSGLAQRGHLWPGDNWRLSWEAITHARLVGGETLTFIVLSVKRGQRLIANYENLDQIAALISSQLEKRGGTVEQ